MTPRGNLPVEPLSRSVWEQVREETFAELDVGIEPPTRHGMRRRRTTIVGAILAATFAVVAVLVLFATRRADISLPTMSRIEATSAFTRTTVGDIAIEATAGSTLFTTGNDAIGWTLLLERGKVSFSVPKRGNRPPLRVQAAAVSVEVVGTRFSVTRDGEHVKVEVLEGLVRVSGDGEVRLLGAGRHWETKAPATPVATSGEGDGPAPDAAKATRGAPVPSPQAEVN